MNFESCQSLEKLVIDNEICGMAYRLIEGIRQRDDPMALDVFKEIVNGDEFLTLPHTLQWFKQEHRYSKLMDRGNYQQWEDAGKPSLPSRASRRVQELLAQEDQDPLEPRLAAELGKIMSSHARRFGMEALPALTEKA